MAYIHSVYARIPTNYRSVAVSKTMKVTVPIHVLLAINANTVSKICGTALPP